MGWLVGQSGPGDYVLAAVIPSIIAAGSLVISPKIVAIEKHSVRILMCLCLALFAILLYKGTNSGMNDRNQFSTTAAIEENKLLQKQLDNQIESQLLYLMECSDKEYRVNLARKAIGLNPLPTEYFCLP